MMHMFLIIFVANKLTFGMLIFFILKFLCIKKKKNLKEKIEFFLDFEILVSSLRL